MANKRNTAVMFFLKNRIVKDTSPIKLKDNDPQTFDKYPAGLYLNLKSYKSVNPANLTPVLNSKKDAKATRHNNPIMTLHHSSKDLQTFTFRTYDRTTK